MNRLNLNFKLTTTEERAAFLKEYLNEPQFQRRPPTEEELETMANYVLWGKDPQSGLNVKQEKYVQLESKYKTWDAHQDESLDALIEQPTFNEATLRPTSSFSYKVPKETFSRSQARKTAPPHLLEELERLWERIDRLDLLLNYYDLSHGRRQDPPRDLLLKRFSEEEQQSLQEKANSISQFKYLKLRHYLVELRREQFTLRDSYQTPILAKEEIITTPIAAPVFDGEIFCAPLGLKQDRTQKLFPDGRYPIPQDFQEDELKRLMTWYWKRKDEERKLSAAALKFDFREEEHVYQAFLMWDEIGDAALDVNIDNSTTQLLQTLLYYIDRTFLNDSQKLILDLKLKRIKNQKIADIVNEKFNKTYTANYISTIFKQKIIPKINDAARLHEKIVENLPYQENFKQCKGCGEVLLIGEENFVHRARSNDGFSTRCKRCDKKARQGRN